jgi:Protein of unknown function (DUF3307)
METLIKIMLGGGLFSVLAFIHFFVDWIFQSHSEAMVKHNNPKIRAKHCLIYTLGFVPLLFFCWQVGALLAWQLVASLLILFVSHFVEDTYLPVFYWAKWIRRPPEMTEPRKITGVDGYISLLPPDPKAGFVAFIQTTLGKILMIAIDQIIHLAFLFPIVWFVLHNLHIDASFFTETVSCNYFVK